MARAARLRRSTDIAAVRAEGRAQRRGAFSVRVRRNDLDTYRIAVTAPGAIGRSVVRNRARRRVREAFRRAMLPLPAAGLDLLVTVRREACLVDFRELERDATGLLEEATR